jgi:hypothetical protein
MINKEIPNPISRVLKTLSFSQLDDFDYSISDLQLSKEEEEKLVSEIGEFSLIKSNSVRVGNQCVETRVIYFNQFDLYIKETLVGPCHYKDTAIDGAAEEINYDIVTPMEKKSIEFE